MPFINRFPVTSFTLSSGETINSINIFKSIILDNNLKTHPTFIKKKLINETKRIENLSFKFYSENLDLYWLVLYLNDIDSFDKIPIDQTKFETKLNKNHPGKVYYIKDGKHIENIEPGDLLVLFTDPTKSTKWKKSGSVKEYDPIFRRIILKHEYENPDNDDTLGSNPDLYFWRKHDQLYVEITPLDFDGNRFKQGRTEDEVDKIISLYDTETQDYEISPFVKLDGNTDPTSQYDFSITGPDSSTAIYKLSNNNLIGDSYGNLSNIKTKTFLDDEIQKNAARKELKFTSLSVSGRLNRFISNITQEDFERGQEITIKS